MGVRVLESPGCRGLGERLEEVALLLTDGSVWLLPGIFVKVGDPSLSLRAAAWALKAQRLGQRPHGHWRMIAPPAKAVAEVAVLPAS